MNTRYARRIAVMLLASVLADQVSADDSAFTTSEGLGRFTGAEIYTHICQGCHMSQGQGAIGAGRYPKLAGNPALVSWQYVAITVLNGKHGMPPFGLPLAQSEAVRAAHLSDAQVAEVVNYVRSHFGNKYKPVATTQEVAALPHPGVTPTGQ